MKPTTTLYTPNLHYASELVNVLLKIEETMPTLKQFVGILIVML